MSKYIPHPHIRGRHFDGPVTVADQAPRDSAVKRFNSGLALKITSGVGTMWCAYIFGIYVLLALPQAIHSGTFGLVQWGASFFLQLVLLSIIMVGQNLQSKASDKRAEQTYNDTEAILSETKQLREQLDSIKAGMQ
jgi:hypothetical protein